MESISLAPGPDLGFLFEHIHAYAWYECRKFRCNFIPCTVCTNTYATYGDWGGRRFGGYHLRMKSSM